MAGLVSLGEGAAFVVACCVSVHGRPFSFHPAEGTWGPGGGLADLGDVSHSSTSGNVHAFLKDGNFSLGPWCL